jgi:hypothetical protein
LLDTLKVAAGLGLTLFFGGCGIEHRSKSQFSGLLTSTDITCPSSTGTLIIQNGDVVFSPADTTWMLRGKAVNGKIDATRERPSFDHKLYKTTLALTLFQDRASGTYTTPSCIYAADLERF